MELRKTTFDTAIVERGGRHKETGKINNHTIY